ncbi:MAG TPA: DUF1343 domain-containing protein [Opitutaceae bacterium]|nr:DUF1343 domain-containing protein [Opitutaceae bacterium]
MTVTLRRQGLSFLTASLSVLLSFLGCSSHASRSPAAGAAAPLAAVVIEPPAPPAALRPAPAGPVLPGIDVLESENFAALRGKRVGLLTHPAGADSRGVSAIEVLRHAPGVKLVALFAPEHGLYGGEENDFGDTVDRETGLPVYSLHAGNSRKPTPRMLKGLDAMVIDLQDIGVRSYTFASAMKLTMEACFEANVEVVVLDRPNPLGGLKVDGPLLDADLVSYVGAFRVPYVHGLTIGELARMAALAPGVLAIPDAVRARGRLTIVPMRGWRRSMRWPDTGLRFVPTSPKITDFAAVVGYAMTGLGCEIGGFSHGIGRFYPFRGLAFKGKTPEQLEREFNAFKLPGVKFVRVSVPDAGGKPVTGVYAEVTDWDAWRPTELSFQLMRLACKWSPRNPFAAAPADKAALFRKLVGSNAWCNAIRTEGARINVEAYLAEWRRRDQLYEQQIRRYWLYPE